MEKFKNIKSIPAYLPLINIDTDMIIPKQFLKTIKRSGLGKSLFYEMRFDEQGNPIKNFVLNNDPYKNSKILISGKNFGCGSSREHAVWALSEWGIKVIIAPSFGSIFYSNCIKNGLLPITLDENKIDLLEGFVSIDPLKNQLSVDLASRIISFGTETIEDFPIGTKDRESLINGLDEIEQTLDKISLVNEFEKSHKAKNPWL